MGYHQRGTGKLVGSDVISLPMNNCSILLRLRREADDEVDVSPEWEVLPPAKQLWQTSVSG
ncbi:MAG: hypothetical protein AAFN92_22035 [Bacteroidota bacterium]